MKITTSLKEESHKALKKYLIGRKLMYRKNGKNVSSLIFKIRFTTDYHMLSTQPSKTTAELELKNLDVLKFRMDDTIELEE